MPRLARLRASPFAWYYVVLSASVGRRLVSSPTDLDALVDCLRVAVQSTGAHLHAGYANAEEVHLAVQTGELPVSAVIGRFALKYARRHNRVHGETGQVWRPHAHVLLIQHEFWLVEVVRVIHGLHRLRAGEGGEGAFWSTDPIYRRPVRGDWVTTGVVLRMLGRHSRNPTVQLDAYRQRFDGPPDPSVIECLRRGCPGEPRVLGSKAFVRAAQAAAGQAAPECKDRRDPTVPEGALRKAVRHVIGQLLSACKRGALRECQRAWKALLTVERVCSHSRARPLPMARGLTVSFAVRHRIATRAQLARFFECDDSTVSARRQQLYEREYQTLLSGSVRRGGRVPRERCRAGKGSMRKPGLLQGGEQEALAARLPEQPGTVAEDALEISSGHGLRSRGSPQG